jgi:flagellar biosynthesis/type III secretory pathway chaperone
MKEIDRLADILTAETDLARALLVVLDAQQEALLSMEADHLTESLERERTLLKATRNLERERLKLLSGIAVAMKGLKPESNQCSLSLLIPYLDRNNASRLSELGRKLRTVSVKIQQRNAQNRILFDHSIRFVRNTIRILTGDSDRRIVDQKI